MKERFYVVFHHDYDPQGVGWQQTRGLMALGGGKLTGEGYLPRHPDAEQQRVEPSGRGTRTSSSAPSARSWV